MGKLEKRLSKLVEDPEKYFTKSLDGAQKMPTERKVKVVTSSGLIGLGVGLATIGLAVLTGSGLNGATVTGITLGHS